MERNNKDDTAVDAQGKMIIDICKSNSLRILNGRTKGDEYGTFTRYPKRKNENPSVIDYTFCGEALMPSIHSFSVLPFSELSDHCCISTFLKINQEINRDDPEDSEIIKVNPNPPKLKFDKGRVQTFQANVLVSEKFEPSKSLVNKPDLNKSDLNLCVLKLNDLLIDSAIKTFPGNTSKRKTKKKQKSQENAGTPRNVAHLKISYEDNAVT